MAIRYYTKRQDTVVINIIFEIATNIEFIPLELFKDKLFLIVLKMKCILSKTICVYNLIHVLIFILFLVKII